MNRIKNLITFLGVGLVSLFLQEEVFHFQEAYALMVYGYLAYSTAFLVADSLFPGPPVSSFFKGKEK